MTKAERLKKAFTLEVPDRPPILGGWLAAPAHIQKLTGCSEDQYWEDSFYWALEAERVLDSDGLIEVFQPIHRGEFRFVDKSHFEKQMTYSPESVIAEIAALPDPEAVKAGFNEEKEYLELKTDLQAKQDLCGEMLWCPADWELIPRAFCYYEYGYENSLLAMSLYPDRYRKWIQVKAEKSRNKAILYARAVREGIHSGVILTGEDAAGQYGPVVSPEFLRKEQFPLIEYAFEPLLEVGAKIIIHCDGDYRAFVDDMLALGASGLQGFQKECSMELEWITDLRTRGGDPLIIFGPISVQTTLLGAADEVKNEVLRAMEICREKASLVFFTSNTINPDIPLENVLTLWQTVTNSTW